MVIFVDAMLKKGRGHRHSPQRSIRAHADVGIPRIEGSSIVRRISTTNRTCGKLVPVLMTTVPELPEVIWVDKKVARLTNESPLTYTVFANEPVKATKRQ